MWVEVWVAGVDVDDGKYMYPHPPTPALYWSCREIPTKKGSLA